MSYDAIETVCMPTPCHGPKRLTYGRPELAAMAGPPGTCRGSRATTSPPVLAGICACAVPASAENPAAVATIATIVTSLDRCIRVPLLGEVSASKDGGRGDGVPRDR